MPKISVIVPVYKAERYLERCVRSILSQTMTDFELILVDDASPDTSGSLCDQLARSDSRVVVIHKPRNDGASAARNTGLDTARGTYVTFCDCDDMVSPSWLAHLLECADEQTLPLGSYCHTEQELGQQKALAVSSGKSGVSEYYRFHQCGVAGYLCNALYSNAILQRHQLRLRCQHEKGDYNEDLLFALQYVRHMRHLVYVGYADYWYDTREDSLSTSANAKRLYFEKYAEKYALWKAFLHEYKQEEQIGELSTAMLYHFLKALDGKPLREFRRMVLSDAMQSCVREADTKNENLQVIALIRKKAVLRLWIRYTLHSWKG